MAKFEGKCPKCGKIHFSHRKNDVILCDCWLCCPICGIEMTQYTSDLALKSYGSDFAVIMVCQLHSPPFFSKLKPVEVICT